MDFDISKLKELTEECARYLREVLSLLKHPRMYLELTEKEGLVTNLVRAVSYMFFLSALSYILQVCKFKSIELSFARDVSIILAFGWISFLLYFVVDLVVNRIVRPRQVFNYLVGMNFILGIPMIILDKLYLDFEIIGLYYLRNLGIFIVLVLICGYFIYAFFESTGYKFAAIVCFAFCMWGMNYSDILVKMPINLGIPNPFEDRIAMEFNKQIDCFITFNDDAQQCILYSDKFLALGQTLLDSVVTKDKNIFVDCTRFKETLASMKNEWNDRKKFIIDENVSRGKEIEHKIETLDFNTTKRIFRKYLKVNTAILKFYRVFDDSLERLHNCVEKGNENLVSEINSSLKLVNECIVDINAGSSICTVLLEDYIKKLMWRMENLPFYHISEENVLWESEIEQLDNLIIQSKKASVNHESKDDKKVIEKYELE